MLPYSLTTSAQADLEEIARYTLEKWGEKQAMQYAASLDDCFENIAQGRASHRAFSKTLPQVQVTRCEHHFVFLLKSETGKPQIIAILHGHMRFIDRLKHRLSQMPHLIGHRTLQRFEAADGIPDGRTAIMVQLIRALEALGISFHGDPINSPGVQLRRASDRAHSKHGE
jgi:toxin ParE1/3/4